jgi:hypothetical protein
VKAALQKRRRRRRRIGRSKFLLKSFTKVRHCFKFSDGGH